jgi:hypothetical protein
MSEVQVESTPTPAPIIEAAPVEVAPIVEALAIDTPAPVVEEDSFAKRFAALARKEKKVRQETEETKLIKDKYVDYETAKKLAKTDPDEFLKKYDLSYEELTQFYINGRPKTDPKVLEIQEELAKVKKERDEEKTKLQEETRQAAISKFKTEQTSVVKSGGARFELINTTGAYDLVYDVTKEYFDTNKDDNGNGKILSHEEAADMVEKYLEQEVEKFLKADKIKNKFAQANGKTETVAKIETPESKTLTNSMTSSANPQSKALSREESIERAARLIKWQ